MTPMARYMNQNAHVAAAASARFQRLVPPISPSTTSRGITNPRVRRPRMGKPDESQAGGAVGFVNTDGSRRIKRITTRSRDISAAVCISQRLLRPGGCRPSTAPASAHRPRAPPSVLNYLLEVPGLAPAESLLRVPSRQGECLRPCEGLHNH